MKKNSWIAAVLNFFFMGLGTLYIGRRKLTGAGLTLSVDIDETSAMIVASRGVLAMHDMEMVFAAAYREHREWDGVVVAAREEQFAMGQHIGQTIIENVFFPESVPNTVFQP